MAFDQFTILRRSQCLEKTVLQISKDYFTWVSKALSIEPFEIAAIKNLISPVSISISRECL